MVSGTNMLATDPLILVRCEVRPFMGLICPAHPPDIGLDWDLGNMKLPFFGLLLLDTDQEQPKKDAFWK